MGVDSILSRDGLRENIILLKVFAVKIGKDMYIITSEPFDLSNLEHDFFTHWRESAMCPHFSAPFSE